MTPGGDPGGAVCVAAGDLAFGGGLLALLRPALDLVTPGGVVALLSSSPGVRADLPRWCALEHHEYLGAEPCGEDGTFRHLLARGPLPEHGFVYVVVPQAQRTSIETLTPLTVITITARVRVARSRFLGNPVVDLLSLEARQ